MSSGRPPAGAHLPPRRPRTPVSYGPAGAHRPLPSSPQRILHLCIDGSMLLPLIRQGILSRAEKVGKKGRGINMYPPMSMLMRVYLCAAEAAAAMQEQQKAMKAHLPIWKPQLRQQPTAVPRRSASETARLRHDENIPLDTPPNADKPQQATETGQTIKYRGVSLHRGNSTQRERWRATTSLSAFPASFFYLGFL